MSQNNKAKTNLYTTKIKLLKEQELTAPDRYTVME